MRIPSQFLLGLAAAACAATLSAQSTRMVSVNSLGDQGDDHSAGAMISSGGRYIAFYSEATNLVPNDGNALHDVFVHNYANGETWCVSVTAAGAVGNGGSFQPAITPDGRFVSFDGFATDLVAGDTNNQSDVFVHDRATGLVERVSVDSAGVQGNSHSQWSAISADGRYVAFDSLARNLVAADGNGASDVFVRDRQAGTTVCVSVNALGDEGNGPSQRPSISPNGRYVVFDSAASNLVPNDQNGRSDVFLYDLVLGTIERVSVDGAGNAGNGDSLMASVSDDGRYVAFGSAASDLVAGDANGAQDAFVRDRQLGQTFRVSLDAQGGDANGPSANPELTADGRYVAFFSYASNLVAADLNADADVFVHDRATGATELLSVNANGIQGNGMSDLPTISADGRLVAFSSDASNLVQVDANGDHDVFVRERWSNDPVLAQSPLTRGQQAVFQVTQAPARETVAVVYSLAGVGSGPCHPQGGFCFGILPPLNLLGQDRSDGGGTAILRVTVPAGAPLVQVHTQAIVLLGPGNADSRLSNTVSATVQP